MQCLVEKKEKDKKLPIIKERNEEEWIATRRNDFFNVSLLLGESFVIRFSPNLFRVRFCFI